MRVHAFYFRVLSHFSCSGIANTTSNTFKSLNIGIRFHLITRKAERNIDILFTIFSNIF